MELNKLKAIAENLLLVSDQPVTVGELVKLFGPDSGKEQIIEALNDLIHDYADRNLQIQHVAGGYQLCTRVEHSDWVKKFHKLDKSSRLSPAALITLSIIAYKQPITRAEIEDIRGVDSGGVIKTLSEKNLIRLMGRKQVVGRPMLYGTSKKFLEYFGLRDVSELPTLKEFSEKPEREDDAPVQPDLPFDQETDASAEEGQEDGE